MCQNLTACIGGSALFPGKPFKDVCVWEYLGADQTPLRGKYVLYADDTTENDHVYPLYKDRIERPANCTFRLNNIEPHDEGWYRMTRDLGQIPDHLSLHHLHVIGICQNLTAYIGGSALFPGRPFKDVCVWEYLGADQTPLRGKYVLYADDTTENDHVYPPYKDRIERPANCTFRLNNIDHQDEGWYRMTRDLGQIPDHKSLHYLHVIDAVQRHSEAGIGMEKREHDSAIDTDIGRSHAGAASSLVLVLLLIAGLLLLLKCRKSEDTLQTAIQYTPASVNGSGMNSSGEAMQRLQPDPLNMESLHNGTRLI